ncbi:unnamed protein product, partial [Didymodactylos carnosus]
MLTCNWSIESIRELILHIDNSKEKLEHLLHSLDPVYEYNLKKYDCNIRGNNLFDILRLYSSKNWTKEIHDLAMFQIFKGSYDKNLQQLITEIFELNKEQKISILQNQKLITQYNNVENCYENKSIICPQFDIIKKWTTSEIKEWSKKVKTNNVSQYEKIAIIKRTVVITSQFPPRDIQLLSLLILMNSENKMGRLCQINTGEGKTTIVAMLAAIKALEGHNYYQSLIKNKAMELLNPQSDSKHALLTTTEGIAKGIATNKIPGLSSVLQINEARLALNELDKFVPNFINSLNKEIEKIYKE